MHRKFKFRILYSPTASQKKKMKIHLQIINSSKPSRYDIETQTLSLITRLMYNFFFFFNFLNTIHDIWFPEYDINIDNK